MEKVKYSLTHAKHASALCLAPGLFRALRRGDRKRTKLAVTYDYRDDCTIEISGPEPLGADDLRVLQGLIALAGLSGRTLGAEPITAEGRELRESLLLTGLAVTKMSMMVDCSYWELAREIGLGKGGSQIDSVKRCIERLWKVSIIVDERGCRHGYRLLSQYAAEAGAGRLFVALNPLIANSILGVSQHVRISLMEIRRLKGEGTRLLHQRLCAWINPGRRREVAMDTLCRYLWPDAVSASSARKRRERVRAALAELEAIDWSVEEYAKGRYRIGRPKV